MATCTSGMAGRGESMNSTVVLQPNQSYYDDPRQLHDAEAIELDRELGLASNGQYNRNWGGQNEKWFSGAGQLVLAEPVRQPLSLERRQP